MTRDSLPLRRTPATSIVIAALLAALLLPAGASAGKDLFVGVAEDAFKLEPRNAVPIAKRLGFRAGRITLDWNPGQSALEPTQAAEIRRAVRGAMGLRIVVAIYADRALDAPVTAELQGQYCSFARDLLRRFPTLRDVVVWNEPNKTFFWRPQYADDGSSAAPAAYAALLARCWDALHGLRADANLIGPVLAPRGNDDPLAPSNVSHSPGAFIRKLGAAYRASGRELPILDTIGHHAHGATSAERPYRKHRNRFSISQGDLDQLIGALGAAFVGTRQPYPGRCVGGRCTEVWYLEGGFQTVPDPGKQRFYSGEETEPRPVEDGAEPALTPLPDERVRASEQASQIAAALRLAYCEPHVGAFFNFLLWDERSLEGWQSGALWADRTPKGSFAAFKAAIAEVHAGEVDCSPYRAPVARVERALARTPTPVEPDEQPAPPPTATSSPEPTTSTSRTTTNGQAAPPAGDTDGGDSTALVVGGALALLALGGLAAALIRRRRLLPGSRDRR